MKRYLYFIILLIAVATACKEPYTAPDIQNNKNYLVVEGFINTGGVDSTIIKLSRTVNLGSKTTLKPEINASVTIESDDNTIRLGLTGLYDGIYYIKAPALSNTRLYRIRIRTAGGKEYVSDFTPAKASPPIDDITWEGQTSGIKGVQVYANTHDNSNNSKYYKWDYIETYRFRSTIPSSYIVKNNAIELRSADENIYECWRTINSSSITLANSTKLAQDIISQAPLIKIPAGDEKISIKYSVLVKQQVLTEEAFKFWEILKKNTEQVGSIFDAQPSQLKGNIHSTTNADEIVIGYISAGTTTTKRIFISREQIPRSLWYTAPASACREDSILNDNVQEVFIKGGMIPVSAIISDNGMVLGYTGSSRPCVDCTLRGTNRKPAFWE